MENKMIIQNGKHGLDLNSYDHFTDVWIPIRKQPGEISDTIFFTEEVFYLIEKIKQISLLNYYFFETSK